MIEKMGGTVKVDSTEGKGTTFTVDLCLITKPIQNYEMIQLSHDSKEIKVEPKAYVNS